MQADLANLLQLSEHKLNLLQQHDICTTESFLIHPDDALRRILKLKAEEIAGFKKLITYKPVSGVQYLKDLQAKGKTISTGIHQLDSLFSSGGIASDEVIEIIGPAASGKSMLLFTIMINVLRDNPDMEVLFVDTKFDFRAKKLQSMMRSRDITEAVQAQILKRIRVERARSPEDLIKALKVLLIAPQAYEKIKLVMIDSVTVPFYLYMGCTMFSLKLMTFAIDQMKRLAMSHVAILVTNLALTTRENLFPSQRTSNPSQSTNENLSENINEGEETTKESNMKAAMGKFWGSVAHHKILINFIDNPHSALSDLEEVHREVSLFDSTTAAPSNPKHVTITSKGVV